MRFIVTLLFLLTSISNFSQSSFVSGWLPKVNFSTKFSDNIGWNNSLETRQIIYNNKFKFKHSLVDYSTFLSIKTANKHSFSLGYILRFINEDIVHRSIEQYNLIHKTEKMTFDHRFRFEQFYIKNVDIQYRTRYQFTLKKPLFKNINNGLDWYVKLSNEYLYQFNEKNFEIRLSPYLGYNIGKNDKIEFSIDYRVAKLLDSNQFNSLWFRTTCYIIL